MISRRVLANLTAFVTLFAVLGFWALHNVVQLDQIERPYSIVAEFESSPGLQANVEATYLGVSVGSVDQVRLEQGHVRVVIDIDRGVEIPEGVSAAVRRKSAVGEPYVALDPPADASGARPIDPDEGYTIPLARTSVPLSYGQLFGAIDDLVSAVPPDDFGTVVDELATALEGRGDELRQILASSDDLTTTLATRTEVFDQLAGELTQLTHTLATRADGIGSSFDDLASLTGALAASSDDLRRLLDEAPSFGVQVQSLLDATYDDLACSFTDIGTVFRTVGTDAHVEDLVRVLRAAAGARDALDASMIGPGDGGADGPYVSGSFGVVQDNPPDPYSSPATLPAPRRIVGCTGAGAGGGSAGPGSGVAGLGPGAGPRPSGDVRVPDRVRPGALDLPASTTADLDGDGSRVLLVALAAALVLGALFSRPWRWVAARRGPDSGDA